MTIKTTHAAAKLIEAVKLDAMIRQLVTAVVNSAPVTRGSDDRSPPQGPVPQVAD